MVDASPSPASSAGGKPSRLTGLAFIAGQLLLIVLLLRELDMLTPAFRRIIYVATPGFLINHLLPARFRLPFFVLLSFACMLLVLGTPPDPERFWDASLAVPRAGLLVAVGGILIAICHLPVGFWLRVGLLVTAGAAAAVFRAGLQPTGGLEIVWILVAALFMFRVIIYLYDVSTATVRPTLGQSLGYFFLIPNICCTFFPVIDFKTFCRSHYNEDALVIYQRGVRWIFRGIIQMLIYRYLDQLYPIRASAVDSGADLFKYLFTNSFLYLNVSGQFHLIIGLLLLFGFNLPATNNNYFLAESFTDYWRRVNIYWKDFILKIFYYPIYFRLKNRGATFALVIATLWAFFITWLLHLYQTWWLKGSASVTWPDSLFWFILGLLILVNSLWEMKRGRKRTLASSTVTWREAAGRAGRTAATFTAICLLWSLWSSPSIGVWLGLWKYADHRTLLGAVALLLAVMAAKILIDVVPLWRKQAAGTRTPATSSFQRDLWQCAVPLLAVLLMVAGAIRGYLPDPHFERIRPNLNTIFVYGILESGDSFPPKRGLSEKNYYQQLTSLDEGNRQLWEAQTNQLIWKTVSWTKRPVVEVKDFRLEAMTPSSRAPAYETADFETNRWGMRDQDYQLKKPAGTMRIAMLGSSHTMGYAVTRAEVFESVLERKLNQTPPEFFQSAKCEILNFAHVFYGPLNQVAVLEKQVEQFRPDIVILAGNLRDLLHANYNLRTMATRQNPLPANLTQILTDARIVPELNEGLAEKRLKPFEPLIVAWAFDEIVAECRKIGALPIYFFFPAPGLELPFTPKREREAEILLTEAARAGFIVWNGTDIFANQNLDELVTAVIPHSNAKAHALIADRLYRFLATDPRLAGLGRDPAAAGSSTRP